jgi:hypothetical protein
MTTDPAVNALYDREQTLRSRLNAFLQERLSLPARDYYAALDQHSLAELKSVLSDINNIFTLKVCVGFVQWLADKLNLSEDVQRHIELSILKNPPNANGYDVEISDPIKVVAEIKCNVPINRGAVYGSAQRNGIAKDVESLILGKTKSRMKPNECLKFLVFLDTPNIRAATTHFIKNMKQHREAVVLAASDVKPDNVEKLYVVHVGHAR